MFKKEGERATEKCCSCSFFFFSFFRDCRFISFSFFFFGFILFLIEKQAFADISDVLPLPQEKK